MNTSKHVKVTYNEDGSVIRQTIETADGKTISEHLEHFTAEDWAKEKESCLKEKTTKEETTKEETSKEAKKEKQEKDLEVILRKIWDNPSCTSSDIEFVNKLMEWSINFTSDIKKKMFPFLLIDMDLIKELENDEFTESCSKHNDDINKDINKMNVEIFKMLIEKNIELQKVAIIAASEKRGGVPKDSIDIMTEEVNKKRECLLEFVSYLEKL